MTTSPQRYTRVAILLHWLIAILILVMLLIGESWIKDQKWLTPPVNGTNPALHASVGLLILILSLARLGWRLMNPPPSDVPMPAWQATASHLLHWGFYALMVLVPLSGMADLDRVIGKSHPEYANLTFFNTFTIPHFSMNWFGGLHDIFTKLIWALLAVHVLAALKHQFIDKDGLLKRMLPQ